MEFTAARLKVFVIKKFKRSVQPYRRLLRYFSMRLKNILLTLYTAQIF